MRRSCRGYGFSSPSCPVKWTTGKGYKPLDNKADGLQHYMFSVAIENCRTSDYWSEKITDTFATYTIPIYWGSPDIGKTFDLRGIIVVNDLDELELTIRQCHEEGSKFYNSHEIWEAREYNFKKAKELRVAEDYIYKEILEPKGLV